MDVDRPGSPPSSVQRFLLGWAWRASSLSTVLGSPGPQHLHSPSQPWQEPLSHSLSSLPPPGDPEGLGQWPCCSSLEHGLGGRRVWGSHGVTSGTSNGEDRE